MHKVLLTGVTGFLGSRTAITLLNRGYEVIGTLRNKERSSQIKAAIARHTSNIGLLSLAEANLMDGHVWDELMEGVNFVQHIASPFPRVNPKHEDELVIPARDGTLAILTAASAHAVKRVVLTSSAGAIMYGRNKNDRNGTYTEADWTDTRNKTDTTPYYRSKTIAERAAWEFMGKDRSGLELAVICPGVILGPVLEKDFGTSAEFVIKMMDGSLPGIPNFGLNIVDVRSVADLLVLAMERPEADGERFAASAGYLQLQEIAAILKAKFPDKKVSTRRLPDSLVRLFSYFDKSVKLVLPDLGAERKIDSSKAVKMLDWKPVSGREAVIACADSLVELGLV